MNNKQIINGDSQFFQDLINEQKNIMVNGTSMPKGYYNLLVSIRDCGLYAKGIKPNIQFRIADLKIYFGIKGSASSMYDQLQEIKIALRTYGQD